MALRAVLSDDVLKHLTGGSLGLELQCRMDRPAQELYYSESRVVKEALVQSVAISKVSRGLVFVANKV